MTTEKLSELSVLLNLVIGRWIPPQGKYDLNAITKRANELLEEYLQPYKVNQVNESTTKVD